MTGNVIGVFILGVFAGWLAEWLFVTFVMAKPKAESVPTMVDNERHSKDDTEKKRDQAVPSVDKNTERVEEKVKDKDKDNVNVNHVNVADNTKETRESSDKNSATGDEEAATTVIKEEQQTLTLNNDSETEITKINDDKSDDKPQVIEKAEAEKGVEPVQHDDFMRLKGIGPKLAESIKKTKINRYDELSALTGEELIAKLEASGAVIVNRPAFVHIPKQAALAAKGDWEALETLKKSI